VGAWRGKRAILAEVGAAVAQLDQVAVVDGAEICAHPAHDLLAGHHGERRLRTDLGGKGAGTLHHRLGRVEQLVDEPDCQCLLGADQSRCQQQIDGPPDPH
jgi:hypothetical protein